MEPPRKFLTEFEECLVAYAGRDSRNLRTHSTSKVHFAVGVLSECIFGCDFFCS